MANALNILDANPLEHLASDLAISQYNFESILNGLVAWDSAKMDTVTIRLATNTDPYFVDYTIKTKYSYDTASGSSASAVGLSSGNFAYKEKAKISALYDPDSDKTDKVNLRVNCVNNGSTTWKVYADATIYDETKKDPETDAYYINNTTYKHSYVADLYFHNAVIEEGVPTSIKLYRTLATVNAGNEISSDNSKAVVVDYEDVKVPTTDVRSGKTLVYYSGKVYVADGDIKANTPPNLSDSKYAVFCNEYDDDTTYKYGAYVYYRGSFYVFVGESNAAIPPYTSELDEDYNQYVIEYNDKYWTEAFLVDLNSTITGSSVLRITTTTDYSGFVLRNIGDDSNESTDIRMTSSMKIKGTAAVPNSGVEILSTSNYNRWPMTTSKWKSGKTYSTDTSKGVYDLQDYTAVMVFNHADSSTKKTNFINYDGPDLNQGLAVFLPVDVLLDDGSVAEPEDGFMFEYLIRIWPDPSYNNSTVNDLIINKAQVYFYNVSDYTDFDWSKRTFSSDNVQPIAKFSMARLTNFYVFSENVGVPDRPVVYKARFVYSKSEHRWRTYDYYQMPDHVFLSPMGFVDPMAGGDSYAGVETGGFPLFQDPFCGTDLSPVRMTEDYTARIQSEVE